MLLTSMASTRRRILLLVAGCALPLFFVAVTTSYFYPDYLPPTFHARPVVTQAPLEEAEEPLKHASITTASSHSSTPTTRWTYDYSRDEHNFGLTDEQCDAAFPGFFDEIDRAVSYREFLGKLTRNDVDIKWRPDEILRAMIYDRQLYIIEARWAPHGFDTPRALAILSSINRAIVAFQGSVPNIEFSFCLGDWATLDPTEKHAVWALTRRAEEEEKWVMPDFGYWSWPLDVVGEYTQVRNVIFDLESKMAFKDKKPQAVWRGAIGTNPLREDLVAVTKDKPWSDVQEIIWLNMTTMAPGMADLSLTMPEHCRYQYAVHTEGHSYSGRGKYLLNCNSVVVMHKLDWIEPHTHLFVAEGPEQNILQVERDWSDLEEKIQGLIANTTEAQRIANNSVQTFRERYLTPAAQACYWRRLFWGWKSVQGFDPELWEEVEVADPPEPEVPAPADNGMIGNEELRDDEGEPAAETSKRGVKTVRRMRGTPYETFILQGYQPKDGLKH